VTKERKLEITIQTSQLLTIRGSPSSRAWCPQCGAEMEVVTLETAALLANTILGRAKAGSLSADWHVSQSPDGSPRICLQSLLQELGREGKSSRSGRIKGLLPDS